MDLSLIVSQFVEHYPILASVLMVIGVLRAINKPLFSLAHTLVEATPTTKDDEAVARVEASSGYKSVMYVLDWFASVKVAPKK